MLVFSISMDQRVYIGDDIIVTVVEIRGEKVRLGFEAPSDVSLNREEIWLRIQEQKAEDAARQSADELRASTGV